MESKYIGYLKTDFKSALDLLEINIKNCSDELWEKKYGGDYYWEQVYHSMLVIYMALPSEGREISPIIKNAGMLNGKASPDQPHDKKLMLECLENTRKYVNEYLSGLKEEDLDTLVDLFGRQKAPLFNKISIAYSHIFYHIGVCDAALRDHGLKAAI